MGERLDGREKDGVESWPGRKEVVLGEKEGFVGD
jgi:hypothetical protein